MNAKLTAKETALLTAIAERHFSYFDQGLVANDSGIWTECMTAEVAGTRYNVSDTQRGVATVIASLGRKGFLVTLAANEEDGAWTMLTEAGQAWVEAYNGESEEAILDQAIAERMTPATEEAPADDTTVLSALVNEYKEGDTEWTEVTFADASRTVRRRRQVSGAWRTDFWGITAEGKKVSTTSKAAKAAREAGSFSI